LLNGRGWNLEENWKSPRFLRSAKRKKAATLANKRQETRGNETAGSFLGTHRLVVGGEGAAAALAGGVVAADPAARVGWLGARVRRRRRGAALEVEELGGDRHARGRGRGVSAREGRREAAANCYSPTHF